VWQKHEKEFYYLNLNEVSCKLAPIEWQYLV